jgi:hypothetical protein
MIGQGLNFWFRQLPFSVVNRDDFGWGLGYLSPLLHLYYTGLLVREASFARLHQTSRLPDIVDLYNTRLVEQHTCRITGNASIMGSIRLSTLAIGVGQK